MVSSSITYSKEEYAAKLAADKKARQQSTRLMARCCDCGNIAQKGSSRCDPCESPHLREAMAREALVQFNYETAGMSLEERIVRIEKILITKGWI